MIRQAAGHLTGTALSTARLVVKLPLWGARQVLGHVRGARDSGEGRASAGPVAEATPQRPRAATPPPQAETEVEAEREPEVVLSVDAPPAEVEPPVDVVGEALAEEPPPAPGPEHIEEQAEVVYSSSSPDQERGSTSR